MREKVAMQLALNLIAQGFIFFVSYLKMRYISVYLIGAIAFATSVSGFFTFFIDLGITAIHFQYSAKQDFQTYFGSYFSIKLCLIFANYAFPFIWYLMGGFSGDPVIEQLIIVCLFTGLVTAFAEVFGTNLRVRLKVLKLEIANFVIQIINAGIQAYIALNVASFANPAINIIQINFIMQILRLFAFFTLNVHEAIFTRPNLTKIRQYLIDAKFILIQTIFEVICLYLGMVLIGLDFGLEELAYYNFAMNYFVNVFLTILIAIYPIFHALFPKLLLEKRSSEVNAIIYQFEKYAFLFFQFLVISVWLYAEVALELLLPNYLPSVKYLLLLVFIPLFDAILRPYWGNLFLGKKQNVDAKIGFFINISTITLQILLIPTQFFSIPMAGLGPWGFIIIYWSMYIFRNILYRHYSRKFFGVFSRVKFGKNILIGVASFSAIFGLNQLLIPILGSGFRFLGVSSICLIGIYVALLVFTKELTKTDFRYFLSLIKFSNYVNSLKEELKHEQPPRHKE